MSSPFDQFLTSDLPKISDIAKQLEDYREMMETGNISKYQYQQIAEDLLNYQNIVQISGEIEIQEKLKETFQILAQVVTAAISLV